jgi:hypothetical protein
MQHRRKWILLVLAMSLILSMGARAGSDETDEALDRFKEEMRSDSDRDRITAISRIAPLPGKDVSKAIRRVVARDRSERVQAAAACALARRGDSKDLRFLLNSLPAFKKRPVALAGVVDAIGVYRDPKAADKVADIARSWMRKHKYPTLAAIRTLGKIPCRKSVTHLIKIFELTYVNPGYGPARGAATPPVDGSSPGSGNVSSDTVARLSDFRQYIHASLRGLTGEAIGNQVAVWKEWWDENERDFDFKGAREDPNEVLRVSVPEFRYSIARPDDKWKWTDEPEEGFTRTAELRQHTKVVARLSILTYDIWRRSPAKTIEMAELAKKELHEKFRELGDKEVWNVDARLDGIPGLRHKITGKRRGGEFMVRQTMVVHRDVMYVIRETILPGIGRDDRKVAEDFIASFKFML